MKQELKEALRQIVNKILNMTDEEYNEMLHQHSTERNLTENPNKEIKLRDSIAKISLPFNNNFSRIENETNNNTEE
jgi:hypothetical protein